ncbi:hypothetical protein QZN11_16560 [Streptomyces gramineus]|uniref:hypothetical protein n=1 Tax=Streptomyces gramineus TaxID=910542 RepID=UPI00398B46EA
MPRRRVFRLWIRHGDALAREVGESEARNMLASARRRLPVLEGRRAIMLPLCRPTEEGSASGITRPGRGDGGRGPDERNRT